MKILVINCGSSSLKYQLIDMQGEKVLCKGLCERIGMESSMITHEANGNKATTPAIFPTHTEAFAEVVKKMTTGDGKVIDDVSEINAIGHRVVHGGEKFQASCLITPEVIETLRELSPLAPLHNPAGILGIEAAKKVFGDIPNVAVFDTAFHSTMPPKAFMYAIPYEYYICTVKLKNKDLSHLPVEVLTEEQLSAYSLYMRTLGNRPDLFGKAQYPNASTIKQPTYYDIPPEALKDDRFAAMMEEATKYIGYPYVWGGSSPSTSFDCSGYISWVLNHSGWNVGRQTAQGLYNLCTPVSMAQVKPGDLVFFKGTYDTPGVSHCGIYVGNSIMLHCGDPISYTNLNSKYWQEHFYSYGRLP